MQYTVRAFEETDAQTIKDILSDYRLHTSYIWDRGAMDEKEIAEWVKRHTAFPYFVLVLEENRMACGFAAISQFRSHKGYNRTAETSIYLLPNKTGTGGGTMLMKALIKRAGQNGIKLLTAWIDEENHPSVRFHQKLGFMYAGKMEGAGELDGHERSVLIYNYRIGETT